MVDTIKIDPMKLVAHGDYNHAASESPTCWECLREGEMSRHDCYWREAIENAKLEDKHE